MIIAIDASNILSEGGREHLSQILNNANFTYIKKIYVWTSKKNFRFIKKNKKIIKISNFFIEFNIFTKIIWQFFLFSKEIRKNNCDILLLLSGFNLSKKICKRVSFFQNLLPFEYTKKYRIFFFIKMKILKFFYLKSIDNSDAVIFPSLHTKNIILNKKKKFFRVIYHGADEIYFRKFNRNKNIKKLYFSLIYVSSIDFYKNQFNLIKSIAILKNRGFKIKLFLVGDFLNLSIKKKIFNLTKLLSLKKNIFFYKNLNKNKIITLLKKADVSVYPSFTEAFGISLLESMAFSVPICCSRSSSLPEILKKGGLYFDPSDEVDIANKIETLLKSKNLASKSSIVSYNIAKNFSWAKCSLKTFNFLHEINKKKYFDS